MTRTLSASVLALTVAFSGLAAAPAKASHKDIGRILVGAAAIAMIAKAVDNNKKRNRVVVAPPKAAPPHYHPPKRPVHVPHPPRPQPPLYQPPIYQPPVTFKGFLPSECGFDVRRGNKKRGVYSKICLSELMVRAQTLPAVCEDRVTTSTGRRTQVYDAICLNDRGYSDEAGQYN